MTAPLSSSVLVAGRMLPGVGPFQMNTAFSILSRLHKRM